MPAKRLLNNMVRILQDERELIKKNLQRIETALEALTGMVAKKEAQPKRKRGAMSAETKAKLSRAAKARWAKIKR